MSDLVERILNRIGSEFDGECHLSEAEAREVCARIASLETELQALRKALEPFAREAENWNSIFGDNFIPNLTPSVPEPGDRELAAFTVGDLRRARAALRNSGGGE